MSVRRCATSAALALVLVAAGCSSGDDEPAAAETTAGDTAAYVVTMPPMQDVAGAPFVAATTWSAAFVKAAGADTVSVLVPPGTPDPFGYVATAEELAPVAEADFVVVDGREAVVADITDAVPADGEVITFSLSNDPDDVKSWVLGLAERFMLGTVAQDWTDRFDESLAGWEATLADHRPTPAPTAIVDESVLTWAELAGVEVLATFDGPDLTAADAAELAALAPDLVLIDQETPPPSTVDLGSGTVVELTNFPDESLDLIELFDTNVQRLVEAFDTL